MDYPSEGPPYHLARNVEKGSWGYFPVVRS